MPVDFNGSQIVSFENRRADEMASLIEGFNGRALMAPSMQARPVDDPSGIENFADRLFADDLDVVVFTTGLGARMLAGSVNEKDRLIGGLRSVVTVARDLKVGAALNELGLEPSVTVAEPNTWNDVLTVLDEESPVDGRSVAVQEYGRSNTRFVEALEERGANVMSVPVYRWDLPDDIEPIRTAIKSMIAGDIDYALFTSSTQVNHLFRVADQLGKTDDLREGFKTICIGSVGPTATATITQQGLTVDYEPDAPKLNPLVHELARRGSDLLLKKRTAAANGVDTNSWRRIDMNWDGYEGGERVFLQACRREPVPHTPVWVMRQAGRYQRAYRNIRKNVTMLELCRTPELAAEVTLMAVDRLGTDAAIIFADILLIVETMGLQLEFAKGEGPVIHNPVRSQADVDRLLKGDVSDFDYVYKAIEITRRALRPDIALIGFCGAPFTVASYVIEGGKSSNYRRTKAMMYTQPDVWNGLMERLVDLLIDYLNHQIDAGADAVQVFDSWAGSLCPDDYRNFVQPHVKRLIAGVRDGTPVINFATGNPALLPLMKEAGGDVIGLDWRVDLADAWARLGDDVAVMGNLDPVVLYATPDAIRAAVKSILDKAAGRPGHIFNLGHGVSPDMDPLNVSELVDAVHELSLTS